MSASSIQDASVENFIESFHDELLNETLFTTLAEAKAQITTWKTALLAARSERWMTGQAAAKRYRLPTFAAVPKVG